MQNDAHDISDDSADDEAEYSSGEIVDDTGEEEDENNVINDPVLAALAATSAPKTAEPVSDEVKLTVEQVFADVAEKVKDEQFVKEVEEGKLRPKNMTVGQVPRTNPALFSKLRRPAQQQDAMLQGAQRALMTATAALVSILDSEVNQEHRVTAGAGLKAAAVAYFKLHSIRKNNLTNVNNRALASVLKGNRISCEPFGEFMFPYKEGELIKELASSVKNDETLQKLFNSKRARKPYTGQKNSSKPNFLEDGQYRRRRKKGPYRPQNGQGNRSKGNGKYNREHDRKRQ